MPPLKAVFVTSFALLREKFIKCIAVSMIPVCTGLSFYLLFSAAAVINPVLAALLFIAALFGVLSPIVYGTLDCFFSLSENGDFECQNVFCAFSDFSLYKRSVSLGAIFLTAVFIIRSVAMFPAGIIKSVTDGSFFDSLGITAPLWTADAVGLGKFFTVLGVAVTVLLSISLYAMGFLAVANCEMHPFECLTVSVKLSFKTYFNLIIFLVALLPIIIASLFILPLIFTAPYIIMCYVTYCRYAVSFYNGVNIRKSGGQS